MPSEDRGHVALALRAERLRHLQGHLPPRHAGLGFCWRRLPGDITRRRVLPVPALGRRGGRPAPGADSPVAPERICIRSSAAGSRVSFSRSTDSTDGFLECAGLLRSLSPVKEEFAGEPASEPPSSGSLPYCAMADAAGSTRAAPEGASKPRRATRVPPARSKPRLFVPPALASRRRARGQFTHVTRSRGEDEIETSASFRRRAGA